MKNDFIKRTNAFGERSPGKSEKMNDQIVSMIAAHAREDINLKEFINLLASFNFKFYSPEEIKKIGKLFNNPLRTLPVSNPFQYLELVTTQVTAYKTNFLIRITSKKQDINLSLRKKTKPVHDIDKCMHDFVMVMKKRYGNEINWFKVVGGMTVSISIQLGVFRNNIFHIMRFSRHLQCVDRIVMEFQEPQQKIITWQHFMVTVKRTIQKILKETKNRDIFDFSQGPQQNSQKHEEFSVHSKGKKISEKTISPYMTINASQFQDSCKLKPKNKWINCEQPRQKCKTQILDEGEAIHINFKKCPLYSRMKITNSFEYFREEKGKSVVLQKQTNQIELPYRTTVGFEPKNSINHIMWNRYKKSKK